MGGWKVTFSGDYVQRAKEASLKAAKATAAEMNSRFQDAIGAEVWQWPNETIRSNGKTAGSPRTIVDSGLLRSSNSYQVDGLKAQFSWKQRYAVAVHEGARLKNGGILPARPWTDAVLGTKPQPGIPVYDYRKRFEQTWKAHFNGKPV
jgi:hypothetical protein